MHNIADFDIDSLVARYDFSVKEWKRALSAMSRGSPFSDEMRSWVHEQQHLYHTVTTPFGLFVWRLRSLQTNTVRNLLILLPQQFSLPVKFPLLGYIETLPQSVRQEFKFTLMLWHAAEMVVNQQLGTLAETEALELKSQFTAGRTPVDFFRIVQANIAAEYEMLENAAQERGEASRDGIRMPVQPLLNESIPDMTSERKLSILTDTVRMTLSEEMAMPSVLESAGLAAEYWWDRNEDITQIFNAAKTSFDRQDSAYILPLTRTSYAIPKAAPHALLATHLAICDLALFGPVLPQHFPLRKSGVHISELFPNLRLEKIWSVLGQVAPMHGPTDYQRFTDEICALLGWVTPSKIVEGSDILRPTIMADARDGVYEEALRWRCALPGIFADPEAAFVDEAAQPFFNTFSCPIMQFTDKVLYSANKPLLEWFTTSYLFYLWHRQLFIGRPSPMKLPWRSTPGEVETLRTTLQEMMEASLGRPAPLPNIVADH